MCKDSGNQSKEGIFFVQMQGYRCREGHGQPLPMSLRLPFLFRQLGSPQAQPGATLCIHAGQLDAYLEYDATIRRGEQGLMTPIGYNQFVRIFNSAPGVQMSLMYIPKGNEMVMGSGPKPNQEDFSHRKELSLQFRLLLLLHQLRNK
jgi:hypothetical protein